MPKALVAVGLAENLPPAPITRAAAHADLIDFLETKHDGIKPAFEHLAAESILPDDDEKGRVTVETKIISGEDGQPMKLVISRPEHSASGKVLPCVIYYHGGAMAVFPTDNPIHRLWCRDVATAGAGPGCVVIMPDFRNAYDEDNRSLRPFPAGLNDCVAAAEWISAHRSELGISSIVAHGESGGGNLAIATTLKLLQERKKGVIDGVYAFCPFISGMYGTPEEQKAAELPSLLEFDGYTIATHDCDLFAWAYDPENK